MRNRILSAICFISVLFGQPSFDAHTITTSADRASSVYAVDVDGDGDMDILSSCGGDDDNNDGQIEWYENNDYESRDIIRVDDCINTDDCLSGKEKRKKKRKE